MRKDRERKKERKQASVELREWEKKKSGLFVLAHYKNLAKVLLLAYEMAKGLLGLDMSFTLLHYFLTA